MKNAIIVLNYNDAKTTITLVDRINLYGKINHIIIVDNCSSDNSYEVLFSKYIKEKKIDIIQTENNIGYAQGNNYGANYAIKKYNPDILFIANPDIMFEENIIGKIENAFAKHKNVAIVAPKVDKGYNSWKLPTYAKTIASMFLYINKIKGNEVYQNLNNEINYVEVVAGSLFCIRANVFKKISGFDNRTFLYYEENILGYKLKENGLKSVILGDAYYEHLHGKTIKKEFKSKIKPFNIMVNSIKIYNKNYLKISTMKYILFNILYFLALLERIIYNFANRLIYTIQLEEVENDYN